MLIAIEKTTTPLPISRHMKVHFVQLFTNNLGTQHKIIAENSPSPIFFKFIIIVVALKFNWNRNSYSTEKSIKFCSDAFTYGIGNRTILMLYKDIHRKGQTWNAVYRVTKDMEVDKWLWNVFLIISHYMLKWYLNTVKAEAFGNAYIKTESNPFNLWLIYWLVQAKFSVYIPIMPNSKQLSKIIFLF